MIDQRELALKAMNFISPFWAMGSARFNEAAARLAAYSGRGSWSAAGSARQFQVGAVAVLPLYGVLTQRPGLFSLWGLGTSTIEFGRAFDRALDDPSIKAIVLDVDSPGGAVAGISELADKIYAGRRRKRIVAVANSEACSASYCLATAAHEVVVTPGALVGSIGVMTVHAEYSEMNKRLGIKTTIIKAGKCKVDGNQYEPLHERARAAIQEIIDDFDQNFVEGIALHRGVKASDVRNGFGEGRVVTAKQAVKLGMASRIATLDEVLAGLSRRFDRGEKDCSSSVEKNLTTRRLEILHGVGGDNGRKDRQLKLRRALLGLEGH
ncbi:MAG: S49 family peptidase [Acidobacteriota bacterium]